MTGGGPFFIPKEEKVSSGGSLFVANEEKAGSGGAFFAAAREEKLESEGAKIFQKLTTAVKQVRLLNFFERTMLIDFIKFNKVSLKR